MNSGECQPLPGCRSSWHPAAPTLAHDFGGVAVMALISVVARLLRER